MTTAEKIANEFGNDGQQFDLPGTADPNDPDGEDTQLSDVCEARGGVPDYRDGRGTDTVAYRFADGSVLTIAGACWDLGCYCHQGAGVVAGPDHNCTKLDPPGPRV